MPLFLCHFIQPGLKQIDLPSNEINCFFDIHLICHREKKKKKSCKAREMFTHKSAFPVYWHATKCLLFSFFFFVPEGFLIRCNTLLTNDKINFISAISGRCNQHAICLSAQNYHFLLALHICRRNIARQSVLTRGGVPCISASDLRDPCHHYLPP